MSDARVISSFGDFESRLRRALGLVGEVGAQFTPSLTSVLIAGNLDAPGNPEYRGKRFSYGQQVTVGAAGRCGLRAIDNVVLTRVWVRTHMASVGLLTIRKSVGATIGTYPNRAVGWRDRMASDTDVAPIETTSTVQAASTQGVELLVDTVTTNLAAPTSELSDVFVGANQQLYVNVSQACTAFAWGFEGYVY